MSGTSNSQACEIFKIRGGKVHDIEALSVSLPGRDEERVGIGTRSER